MRGLCIYLSGNVRNDAFFGFDAHDSGLNQVIHDAAPWIYVGNELTIVAHNLRPDHVIRRRVNACTSHPTFIRIHSCKRRCIYLRCTFSNIKPLWPILDKMLLCTLHTKGGQGRSDGGYIGIYTPKSVYLNFFMWLFCLLDPGQIRYLALCSIWLKS